MLKFYHYKDATYDHRPNRGEYFKLRKSQLRDYLNEAIRENWGLVRGLFNYSPEHFKLTLPTDLGNNPKRILYPSAGFVEKTGKPRATREKKVTYSDQDIETYVPKHDVKQTLVEGKRVRKPVVR